MRTFKDSLGREWALKVTVLQIERVRAAVGGLDLPSLFDEKLEGMAKLLDDPVRLARAVACMAGKQLREKNLAEEDLIESLEGDTLKEAGDALCWAVADFFPEQKKAAAHALLRKLNAIEGEWKKEAKEAVRTLDTLDVSRMLRERSGGRPGTSAGGSPESSASTPGPSPSGS